MSVSIVTKSSRSRLLVGAVVAIVLAGCTPDRATLDLRTAARDGHLEVVLRMPSAALLELELSVPLGGPNTDPATLEVWAHRGVRPAVRLLERELQRGEAPERATVDLRELAGAAVLLSARVHGAAQGVEWLRAELSGVPDGPLELGIEPRPGAPNVVVYLVDALRADALGAYGRDDTPTPNFDRIAAEGTRFDQALTPATWTRPATASLFTGLYPSTHGARDRPDSLTEAAVTLAERMRLAGYRTLGVVANGNVAAHWGFDQGFEVYELPLVPDRDPQGRPRRHLHASEVHEVALREVERLAASGDPIFLYVHVVDPHGPYDPPEWRMGVAKPELPANSEVLARLHNGGEEPVGPELVKALRTLYQGEVAYGDAAFGEFLDGLADRGVLDGAMVLVTADHGEAFLEHGYLSHGMSLHEEEMRIPLLVRAPGRMGEGTVVERPASLIDVLATVAAFAGADGRGTQGVDLATLAAGEVQRFVAAEIDYDGRVWRSIRDDGTKLLVHRNRGDRWLFRPIQDPLETRDLFERGSAPVRRLQHELGLWEERMEHDRLAGARAAAEPDEELVENLRALGYVD